MEIRFPVVEAKHMFHVDIHSGQLWLAKAYFDFESLKSYHVRVVTKINDYSSGWFSMSNIFNFFERKIISLEFLCQCPSH